MGNPLQVAEEEKMRWAMSLSEYIVAAELPVVSMVQESEDQQRSLWQQTCQDFEKQGDNMEAILHLAPLEPGTPLAYQGGRCGGLPGREDRRWLRPSSTAGADGGTGPIRNCGTCGRAQEAFQGQDIAGLRQEHADGAAGGGAAKAPCQASFDWCHDRLGAAGLHWQVLQLHQIDWLGDAAHVLDGSSS